MSKRECKPPVGSGARHTYPKGAPSEALRAEAERIAGPMPVRAQDCREVGSDDCEGVGNRGRGAEVTDYPLIYVWGNYPWRAAHKGMACRIVARQSRNNRIIEFENGERACVSGNALRREPVGAGAGDECQKPRRAKSAVPQSTRPATAGRIAPPPVPTPTTVGKRQGGSRNTGNRGGRAG